MVYSPYSGMGWHLLHQDVTTGIDIEVTAGVGLQVTQVGLEVTPDVGLGLTEVELGDSWFWT